MLAGSLGNIQGYVIDDCIFQEPAGYQDQTAPASWTYGIITNCYFDRTAGYLDGASITGAAKKRLVIANNIIVRDPSSAIHAAITCENWSEGHESVNIEGNQISAGDISIGTASLPEGGYAPGIGQKYINVINNVLNGGGIHLKTPSGYSDVIKYVNVSGNIIKDAKYAGIWCLRVSGPVNIHGNIIKDSNAEHIVDTTNERGLIVLNTTNNAYLYDNSLSMTDTVANGSPFGIRAANCNGVTMNRNTILNTTANSTYSDGGGNVGIIWDNTLDLTTDKTTVVDATTRGEIKLHNIKNANDEFLRIMALGTSGYYIAGQRTGTGSFRSIKFQNAGADIMAIRLQGDGITMFDGKHILMGTTTGSKIGSLATEKIGFWGATPVVQPAGVADATGGTTVDAEARTALNALILRLESIGIIATV